MIETLRKAGLLPRLDGRGGLRVKGWNRVPEKEAQALREFIQANRATLIHELLPENGPRTARRDLPLADALTEQKTRQTAREGLQGEPVIPERCSIEDGEPCPKAAALEIAEMHERGLIKLNVNDNPMTFILPDGQGYGPGDRQYVQALIDEAGAAIISVMPRIMPMMNKEQVMI